jgi:hypothetical protein
MEIMDQSGKSHAAGAVVIGEKRGYFASVNLEIDVFRSLFIRLLTEFQDDLEKIEIRSPQS